MGNSRGCRALVTGASRGVGYTAAEALARRRCNLVINARMKPDLEEAASRLRSKYKVRVEAIPADLRVRREVERLARKALEVLSGLDVVIMSYGNPSCEPCLPHEASWEDWMEAAALYIASTATIARILVEENPVKATLIMISSFSVVEPMPPLSVSDTLRAGLTRLARILARAYPDKLKPLVLVLGSFDTPGARRTVSAIALREGEDPEAYWRERVEKLSPLGRTGRLEELSRLIEWLALDSPEYLTGAPVFLDGSTLKTALP